MRYDEAALPAIGEELGLTLAPEPYRVRGATVWGGRSEVLRVVLWPSLARVDVYAGTSAARFWLLSRTLAGVFAFLVVGSVIAPIAEGVAINLPDTGLHLVSALALAYLAYGTKADGIDQVAAA